ncbi:hypothetical protein P154DRAFT_450184 [Amniculicola lignicola CBS 123094]|uniref:Uncharacterized protein n=1 Tax=Amniculicola lignicola CBS 123094 TaxID=1392246 RepID=A0A6A5VV90_9PLEO|nr:hypothetical protein P154DRAFT_450184 [Amniculicola lignicola CBS 123094]
MRVWLNGRNIRTKRGKRGLDYKNYRLYTIKQIHHNIAYELKLTEEVSQIYPNFHPWLLHLGDNNPLPG